MEKLKTPFNAIYNGLDSNRGKKVMVTNVDECTAHKSWVTIKMDGQYFEVDLNELKY
jgi:hypothetical protein